MNYLDPINRVVDIRRAVRGIFAQQENRITDHRGIDWQPREVSGLVALKSDWQSQKFGFDSVPTFRLTWSNTFHRYWNSGGDPTFFTDASATGIARNGSLLGVSPDGGVVGAAIWKNSSGVAFLHIITDTNKVLRSPLSDTSQWVEIGSFDSESDSEKPSNWFFNAAGNTAHRIAKFALGGPGFSQFSLYEQIIISESGSVSFSAEETSNSYLFSRTQEFTIDDESGREDRRVITTRRPTGEAQIIAADFQNDRPVFLTLQIDVINDWDLFTQGGNTQISESRQNQRTITLKLNSNTIFQIEEYNIFTNDDETMTYNGSTVEINIHDADLRNGFVVFETAKSEFSATRNNSGPITGTKTTTHDKYVFDRTLKLLDSETVIRDSEVSSLPVNASDFPDRNDPDIVERLIRDDETPVGNGFTGQLHWKHDQWRGYVIARPEFLDWSRFYSERDSGSAISNTTNQFEYVTTGDSFQTSLDVPFSSKPDLYIL